MPALQQSRAGHCGVSGGQRVLTREPVMCQGHPCPSSQDIAAAAQSLVALGLTTSAAPELPLCAPPPPQSPHTGGWEWGLVKAVRFLFPCDGQLGAKAR